MRMRANPLKSYVGLRVPARHRVFAAATLSSRLGRGRPTDKYIHGSRVTPVTLRIVKVGQDGRRNLVTDEKIICEKLIDLAELFEELCFEEQAELLSLILKDVGATRRIQQQAERLAVA